MLSTSRTPASTPDFATTSISHGHEILKEPLHSSSAPKEPITKQKRLRRCAGCHEPHSLHVWGLPGPHCPGHDQSTADLLLETSQLLAHSAAKSKTVSHTATSPDLTSMQLPSHGQPSNTPKVVSEQVLLEQKLRELQLEEKRLHVLSALRAQIAEKEAAINNLRETISSATSADATNATRSQQQPQQQQQQPPALNATATATVFQELGLEKGYPPTSAFTMQDLRRQPLQELLSVPAPVVPHSQPHIAPAANLLLPENTTSLGDRFMARPDAHADMFLSPSSVPQDVIKRRYEKVEKKDEAKDQLVDQEALETQEEEPEESLTEEAAENGLEDFNDQPVENELEEEINN